MDRSPTKPTDHPHEAQLAVREDIDVSRLIDRLKVGR